MSSLEFADPLDKDVKPLPACRGCLAVSRPLQPLERALAALYGELVSTNVSPSYVLPQFVCSYCRALLLKFKAFRDKCWSSQNALHNLYTAGVPITIDLLQSVATEAPYPNLQMCVEEVSLDGDENDKKSHYEDVKPFIKQEQISVNKICIEIKQDNADCGSDSDYWLDDTIWKEPEDTKNDVKNTIPKESSEDTKNVVSKTIPKKRSADNTKNAVSKTKKRSALQSGTKTTSNTSKTKARPKPAQKKGKKAPRIQNFEDELVKNINIIKFEQKYNFKAIPLSREEQIERIKARQDAPNYKNANFKCGMCFHTFMTNNTFKKHMAKHELKQGESMCEVCSVCYPSKGKLKEHFRRFHMFEYTCNQCGTACSHSIGALNHYKSHKGVKYDCKICEKSFKSRTSLISHTHLSHGGNVQCSICSETFMGEKGLSSHMSMSHKEAMEAKCKDCDVQFHSVGALQLHLASGDHSHRPCGVCGESFPNDELLKEHQQEHKRSFDCETCGRKYYTLKQLRSHFFTHTSTYNKKPRLQEQGGAYMCELCGITKANTKALESHILSHTKPFQCTHCNQSFGSNYNLKTHLTSKHNDDPSTPSASDWVCQLCDRAFTSNKDRIRHENHVHLKLRPHSCACGATYQDKHKLQIHINTKHLGLPWPKRERKEAREAGYVQDSDEIILTS